RPQGAKAADAVAAQLGLDLNVLDDGEGVGAAGLHRETRSLTDSFIRGSFRDRGQAGINPFVCHHFTSSRRDLHWSHPDSGVTHNYTVDEGPRPRMASFPST